MSGIYLKQSTASQSRGIGPFVDDTDFKTAETGLTIANTDIKLVVNGAASANKNSGGGTHRINGIYGVTFDATDTATVGEMHVSVVVAGALPAFHKFFVLEEAIYDAMFAASAPGYLQPTTPGNTLDVTATGAAGVDWGNVENKATSNNLSDTTVGTAVTVGAAGAAVIANYVWDEDTEDHIVYNSFGARLMVLKVGIAQGGAAGSITLDASASAVNDFYKNQVVQIIEGTGIRQMRTITAYNGTTKVATVTPDWITAPDNASKYYVLPAGTVNVSAPSVVEIRTEMDSNSTKLTDILTDTAEIGVAGAGLTAVDDATLAAIAALNNITAASVWAVGTRVLTAGTNIDGSTFTAIPWNASWDAEVQSECADALVAYDGLVAADLPANFSALLINASGHISRVVLCDTLTTYTGNTPQTADHTAAIADLPTNAELATALGTADDAVLAAIAALNNPSAASIFTAVLTTAMTEAYAADGAAPTLAQAIFLIQQSLHEFAISGTSRTVKKLDGSTTAAVFTLDSATTPTSTTRAS